MRRVAIYNADNPGKIVREERLKQGMTQQELALALRVKPATVAKMELDNHGLNSYQTRRDIAKALGISPLVLGVGGPPDVKTQKLYSTTIIRTALELHREAFYTTGNFGIPAVNKMVGEIAEIIKAEGNKRDILEVYTEYSTLGTLIAREELNQTATDRYIQKSLDAARSLKNPVLLTRALSAASYAMYEFGDLARAETYAREEETLAKKIPNHLRALALIDLGLATGDIQPIEQARTLVMRDNDFPELKLDPNYCYMYGGAVLLSNGNIDGAMAYLEEAEEKTDTRFVRRRCIIQTLQARCYLAMEEHDNAAHVASTAMTLARSSKSKPRIEQLRGLVNDIRAKK